MPTGIHYTVEFRRLVGFAVLRENLNPEQIMRILTPCLDNPDISIRYITDLSARMRNDRTWANNYILGPRSRSGRPRKLDNFEEYIFISTIRNNNGATFRQLITDYQILMTGQPPVNEVLPYSISTACRIQARNGITGKVPEWRNINRDEAERLAYQEHMVFVNPEHLVDVDETSQAPSTIINRYGRSDRGTPCVRDQIVIGTRSFSTICALTPRGFLAFSVYEGGIGADQVKEFLDLLEPRLLEHSWCILDNASVHHTDEVRIRVQQISFGRFTYCARYSPDLKPVERGISLVKKYIRRNYDRAQLDPIGMIEEAFRYYSIGNPGAASVYHFFDLYRRNRFNYFYG